MERTTESKPFCYMHLSRNVHAMDVLAELARREVEIETALKRGWRAIDVEGTRSMDMLVALALNGVLSPERIQQVVFDISEGIKEVPKAARIYVKALVKAGLVEVIIRPSRRGGKLTVVRLTVRGMRKAAECMGEEAFV